MIQGSGRTDFYDWNIHNLFHTFISAVIKHKKGNNIMDTQQSKVIPNPVIPDPGELGGLYALVDRFAIEMKLKLAKKFGEGKTGWNKPEYISRHNAENILNAAYHIQEGEDQEIDLANFALFQWYVKDIYGGKEGIEKYLEQQKQWKENNQALIAGQPGSLKEAAKIINKKTTKQKGTGKKK